MKSYINRLAGLILVAAMFFCQQAKPMNPFSWFQDEVTNTLGRIERESSLTQKDLDNWYSLVGRGTRFIGSATGSMLKIAKAVPTLIAYSVTTAVAAAGVGHYLYGFESIKNSLLSVKDSLGSYAVELFEKVPDKTGDVIGETITTQPTAGPVLSAVTEVIADPSQTESVISVLTDVVSPTTLPESIPTMTTESAVPSMMQAMHNYIYSPDNKWKVTGFKTVGALVALYASYKYLYPRTRQAMIDKLVKYQKFCKRINLLNGTLDAIKISLIGSSSSPVVFGRVLENIAEQNTVASKLLEQIDIEFYSGEGTQELKELRNNIRNYSERIASLRQANQSALQAEEKRLLELQGIAAKNELELIELRKQQAEEAYKNSWRKSLYDAAGVVGSGIKTTWGGIKEGASAMEKTVKFINKQGFKTVGMGAVGYFVIQGGHAVWKQYAQ